MCGAAKLTAQSTSPLVLGTRLFPPMGTYTNLIKCVMRPLVRQMETDDQASQHLLKFMENFYSVFPELKSQDVSRAVLC
jgi:hypothetical protein